MSTIHIHRDHQLGLSEAREIAQQWADKATQKFDLQCAMLSGDTSDTLTFSRSGLQGSLVVAADHFELQAKLGFLMAAFAPSIQAEIEKNLDQLLAQHAAAAATSATGPGTA
jgi:putative polyhydroxyalkanoate system protein